jgi:hypothetical protein
MSRPVSTWSTRNRKRLQGRQCRCHAEEPERRVRDCGEDRPSPESFGALKGKTGIFASRADRQDRDTALINAPALARNLERYLRQRAEAERKHEAQERAVRLKVSVDIPALSPSAKQTLERVRDAIDRNDLPAGLEYALADKMVKAELEGFAKAVVRAFRRANLPAVLGAKDTKRRGLQICHMQG